MGFAPLIFGHLRRNWLRALSTVIAMSLCIFIFCVMQATTRAVNAGLQTASSSRLITQNAIGWIFTLPVTYKQKISSMPGVSAVSSVTWFGGVYRDLRDFFPNLAVDPESYLVLHPEYVLSPEARKSFLADKRSCVVGRGLAQKFGWKVGDTVSLQSFIPAYRKDGAFELVIRGLFDADRRRFPGTDEKLLLFHFDYFYDSLGGRIGPVTYTVGVADPDQAGAISKSIDDLFRNSETETRTQTEQAFRASFVSLAGNLSLMLNVIALAASCTILLVTANTMTMAMRERRNEIAVLKTLGFSGWRVMNLVLGEGLSLGLVGGGLGVLLSIVAVRALPSFPLVGDVVRSAPQQGLSPLVATSGLALALVLSLLAALVPALIAFRARVNDMLRSV
jgi:putative ABC transport system permease protein